MRSLKKGRAGVGPASGRPATGRAHFFFVACVAFVCGLLACVVFAGAGALACVTGLLACVVFVVACLTGATCFVCWRAGTVCFTWGWLAILGADCVVLAGVCLAGAVCLICWPAGTVCFTWGWLATLGADCVFFVVVCFTWGWPAAFGAVRLTVCAGDVCLIAGWPAAFGAVTDLGWLTGLIDAAGVFVTGLDRVAGVFPAGSIWVRFGSCVDFAVYCGVTGFDVSLTGFAEAALPLVAGLVAFPAVLAGVVVFGPETFGVCVAFAAMPPLFSGAEVGATGVLALSDGAGEAADFMPCPEPCRAVAGG